MSKPSVTDNARTEAEQRYPALNSDDETLTYPRSAVREHARGGFVKGYEAGWAAARAETTTEPTDAQVLAALNAMHPKAAAPSLDYWGDKSADEMRAALRAAWTEADRG